MFANGNLGEKVGDAISGMRDNFEQVRADLIELYESDADPDAMEKVRDDSEFVQDQWW
jgi:hypothetical protein